MRKSRSRDIYKNVKPDEKWAFVSNVNPNCPSKKAGIHSGDVILKFNNIEIVKMTDLPRVVAESDVGSIAKVDIWRKNKLITIEVKLGQLPEETFVKRKKTSNKICTILKVTWRQYYILGHFGN